MTELQMTEVLVVAGAGTYLVCSIFTRLPYCVASWSFLLVLILYTSSVLSKLQFSPVQERTPGLLVVYVLSCLSVCVC